MKVHDFLFHIIFLNFFVYFIAVYRCIFHDALSLFLTLSLTLCNCRIRNEKCWLQIFDKHIPCICFFIHLFAFFYGINVHTRHTCPVMCMCHSVYVQLYLQHVLVVCGPLCWWQHPPFGYICSVQVYIWPNFVTGAMAFDKNHNSVLHYSQCMTFTSDVISLFSFWASTSRLVVYLAWWHTMCNFNYQINYVCVCQHNQPLMYKIFH